MAALEAFGSAYDAWDVYSTFTDPQATTRDKAISVVGSAAGSILPGAGFGVLGKQIAHRADEAAKVQKAAAEPKGGVYALRDKAGCVAYCGHTNDLSRRAEEHRRDPVKGKLEFEARYRTDDYATRRGLEQRVYDEAGKPPLNRNRPIAEGNKNRKKYDEAADDFLGRADSRKSADKNPKDKGGRDGADREND